MRTRVNLSLPRETDEDLEALAFVTGKTKSAIVRAGIEAQRDAMLSTPTGAKVFEDARVAVACR